MSLASSLVQTSMAPTARHCPGSTTSVLIPSIAAVERKGCIYDSSPVFGPGCRELCIWQRLRRQSPPYWCLGGSPGRPTLLPSLPELAPTPPSRNLHLALMRPTLMPPRKANMASVGFSLHSHLPEGAPGYFHPQAFPISFHSCAICGRQAQHSVNRWWQVCCFPPPHHQHLSSTALWILSFR